MKRISTEHAAAIAAPKDPEAKAQADPPAPSTEDAGDSKSKVAEPDPKVPESASAVPNEHAASEPTREHVSPDVGQGGTSEVPREDRSAEKPRNLPPGYKKGAHATYAAAEPAPKEPEVKLQGNRPTPAIGHDDDSTSLNKEFQAKIPESPSAVPTEHVAPKPSPEPVTTDAKKESTPQGTQESLAVLTVRNPPDPEERPMPPGYKKPMAKMSATETDQRQTSDIAEPARKPVGPPNPPLNPCTPQSRSAALPRFPRDRLRPKSPER